MNRTDWLKTLKGGDHVTITCHGWEGEAIIERMTRAAFHTGSRSFERATGVEIGETIPDRKRHTMQMPKGLNG